MAEGEGAQGPPGLEGGGGPGAGVYLSQRCGWSLRDAFGALAAGSHADADRALAELKDGRSLSWSFHSYLEAVCRHLAPMERLYASQAFIRSLRGLSDLRHRCALTLERLNACADGASRLLVTQEISRQALEALCESSIEIVEARRELLDAYYEVFSVQGLPTPIRLLELAAVVERRFLILTEPSRTVLEPFRPYIESVQFELSTFLSLMRSQEALQRLNFLETVVNLRRSQNGLASWKGLLEGGREPNTFATLAAIQAALASLSTVYFHDLVDRHIVAGNVKRLIGRARGPEYFLSRLIGFHETTKAEFVSVHLQTALLKSCPTGYQHPSIPYERPSGLRSFPAVFSYPAMLPMNHVVTIVSVHADRDAQLQAGKVALFDEGTFKGKSDKDRYGYYLVRLSPAVVLAAVYLLRPKKTMERTLDSGIRRFLLELAAEVQGVWQPTKLAFL